MSERVLTAEEKQRLQELGPVIYRSYPEVALNRPTTLAGLFQDVMDTEVGDSLFVAIVNEVHEGAYEGADRVVRLLDVLTDDLAKVRTAVIAHLRNDLSEHPKLEKQ